MIMMMILIIIWAKFRWWKSPPPPDFDFVWSTPVPTSSWFWVDCNFILFIYFSSVVDVGPPRIARVLTRFALQTRIYIGAVSPISSVTRGGIWQRSENPNIALWHSTTLKNTGSTRMDHGSGCRSSRWFVRLDFACVSLIGYDL